MPVFKNYLPKHTGIFGYVKEPKVEDIAATDLFYYSPHFYKIAIKFCLKHKITTLPCSCDHSLKYEFNPKTKTFKPSKIPKLQKIAYDTLIFDPIVAEKFKKFDTLFVYNHNELVGILHFTDYNKMPVNIYLYAQIIELEYLLRALAHKYNLTLQDLVDFWVQKASKSQYYKKRLKKYIETVKDLKELGKTPDLTWIYLTDLIDLINHSNVLKISREIQELRNGIMHARNNIDAYFEFSTTTMLRNLEAFLEFFNTVQKLKQVRREVEALLRCKKP